MSRSNAGRGMFSVFAQASTAANFFVRWLVAGCLGLLAVPAYAVPALVVDVSSGAVLYQKDATEPWYPASLTKLMTLYVTLSAVRDHKITMDTPLVVSARAASMPPSKMGFVPGTEVTLDNALKMLLVRSANDLAISVAEGVSGSVEAFAQDMNAAAAQLGMHESHFVNPNGLPDPHHVSSARDMAILGRALYTTFPEHADLFNLGALALGSEVITNHNNLLGRYPGAEGMKTGFTCAAGFNIVASATRGSQRLIVVVLGAPSVLSRTMKVAALFDRGFGGVDHPSMSLTDLGASAGADAPDMHDQICRRRAKTIQAFNAETSMLTAPLVAETGSVASNPTGQQSFSFMPNPFRTAPTMTRVDLAPEPVFAPVPVYIGAAPGYIGPVAQARPGHSPIGTELPPATASAYAAPPVSLNSVKNPLKPDPAAISIKGRHAPPATAVAKSPSMTASANAGEHSEKTDAAVKPAKKVVLKRAVLKKIATKKIIRTAQTEKAKPVKIKEATKSLHAKDHPAVKPKADKGVAAGAE